MGMSSEDPDQPLDFSISSRRRNVDSTFPQPTTPSPQQLQQQQSPTLQPSTTIIHHQTSHHAAFPYVLPVHHQQQSDVHQSLALSSVAPPTCVAPLRLPVPEPRTGLWLQGLADAAAYAHFRRRFLTNNSAPVQVHAPDRDNSTVGVAMCPSTSPMRTDEPDHDQDHDHEQEDEDDEDQERNQGAGNANGNGNGNAAVIKDEAYWERRRKNNEAAKRSRDARRAKEDEIAIRAAFLEQENLKLRVEVAALKNETAKLRCMLYNS